MKRPCLYICCPAPVNSVTSAARTTATASDTPVAARPGLTSHRRSVPRCRQAHRAAPLPRAGQPAPSCARAGHSPAAPATAARASTRSRARLPSRRRHCARPAPTRRRSTQPEARRTRFRPADRTSRAARTRRGSSTQPPPHAPSTRTGYRRERRSMRARRRAAPSRAPLPARPAHSPTPAKRIDADTPVVVMTLPSIT